MPHQQTSFHIIGDPDTVVGYRFAGVTGTGVETAEEARTAFRDAVSSDTTRILLITEPVADMIEREVVAHRLTSEEPYVVAVRDIWGAEAKRKSLEDMIQEAVGVKIVRKENEEE